MKPNRAQFIQFLMAVLLGNGLYFALSPQLPLAARHAAWSIDLGTVVDFWFCLFVYGLIGLGKVFRPKDRKDKDPPSQP